MSLNKTLLALALGLALTACHKDDEAATAAATATDAAATATDAAADAAASATTADAAADMTAEKK